MKREDIKKLIPEITDEALRAILDINGQDIEKTKSDFTKQLETARSELESAKGTITALEASKGEADAVQKELDKYKQAEADRKAAEEAALADQSLRARFDAVKPSDKEYHNAYTGEGVYAKFKEAIGSDEYKGKGDAEIYAAITKDEDIYKNPNRAEDIPGTGNGSGDPAPSPKRFF